MDYLDRAVKTGNEGHENTVKEMEALRKKMTDGDSAAGEVQKQFDTFKELKEKEMNDLKGKVGQMQDSAFQGRVKQAVGDAMGKIRPTLKKGANDAEEQMIEAAIGNELNSFYHDIKAVDHQGTLIYHDQDDKPLINKVNGNHLSAHDIMTGRLTYLVDKKRTQGGSGNNGSFTDGGGDDENKFKLQLPDNVKTKVKLTDYLKNEKKLDPNGADFNKFYMENAKDLPLR